MKLLKPLSSTRDFSRDIIQKYAAKDDGFPEKREARAKQQIVLGLFLMGKVLSLRA
ncbi:hypothetical protein CHCC20348_1548 [Bacillus paralicheniformis]|nr:hypothetical protein CHCC20348_1548 [Bacillus paralicheniformis]